MAQTIKCKNCGAEIEVSEALTHQIEEQVLATLSTKHKKDLDELKRQLEADAEKNARELLEREGKYLDEIRGLKRRDNERELEMKKKLLEEEEKIRLEALKKAEEEHRIKDAEKDKKLQDAIKANEELRRKLEQGSQQTQGESMELALEGRLRAEFPMDIITEVKKGQRGADVLQEVVDKLNRKCGTILWESKNAKWTEGWILKLKEDQRRAKADLAVLVRGVNHYFPLALALRFNLVSLYHERQNQEGQDEKMKILYQYLTGNEFRQRVEAIVEAFGTMQMELEREKRWFSVKWARQEKEIRKVIDHTHGMYGDLQGVIGKSLPEIKTLELPNGEK